MDGRRKHYESEKKLKRLLRRSVQYVVLVSLFALFVWYSSGFSILPHSLNAYFSTFLFSILTRTVQRKYMFLLCNAILAFLASKSLYDAPLVKSSELLLVDQDYDEPLLAETEEGKEHDVGQEVENCEEVVEVEVEGTQDDDEDARNEEELANADELNRKFEEFIRKMKEEIRIEAQTPPIAV